MTATTLIAKGETEEITQCDCCGRADLRRTVHMVEIDSDGNPTGGEFYYGTTCATRHSGKTRAEIANEIRQSESAERETARDLRSYESGQSVDQVVATLNLDFAKPGTRRWIVRRSNRFGSYFAAMFNAPSCESHGELVTIVTAGE